MIDRPTTGAVATTPAITGVSGGIGGIEAQQEAVRLLADHFDDAGHRARHWAARGPRVMADGDLLASGPFSPLTFAAAEAAVLRATTGPDGALGCAVAWEAQAVAVRTALAAILAADELARGAIEARDYALGRVAGVCALGALSAPATWPSLALVGRLGATPGGQRLISRHPGVVEAVFNGVGGLVDGVSIAPGLMRPDTGCTAGTVADLYDEGSPRVGELDPAGLPLPAATGAQPRDLAGVIAGLAGVARLSTGASSPLNGTIAVTSLTDADGTVRHIVYVPGTDDMGTLPWTQDHDVRDMGTNLDLMAGRSTSYGEGILDAMREAGIGPDDPVLMVGHSQGGMQVAALAADDPPFRMTHVVTAGSPLAQVDLPPDVRALSLENHGDVIPLTDGEPNRPGVGQVTVGFDGGGDGLVGHHDYDVYLAGARAADQSTDASVSAEIRALRDDGFIGDGAAVTTQTRVFQVTRR